MGNSVFPPSFKSYQLSLNFVTVNKIKFSDTVTSGYNMGGKWSAEIVFHLTKIRGGGVAKYAVPKIVTSPKAVWFACAFALALCFKINAGIVPIILIRKETKETGFQCDTSNNLSVELLLWIHQCKQTGRLHTVTSSYSRSNDNTSESHVF
jgi:hypothetical protein